MDVHQLMQRAIALALEAERDGNEPVGAVITLDDAVVAEGRNSMLVPRLDATRHAEMEALRAVPRDLWGRATTGGRPYNDYRWSRV